MLRSDKLALLLLKGWQVFDWDMHHSPVVEEMQYRFLEQLKSGTKFNNVDIDDLHDYLILNPPITYAGITPIGGSNILTKEYYFTLDRAFNEEFISSDVSE